MELMKKNDSFVTTRSGKDALFLEYVNECNQNLCPFYKRCGFLKNGLCGFETSFFVRIVKFVLRMEDEGRISETGFAHTTIAILPLYRQLLQLYKMECSLKGQMFVVKKDGTVTTRFHPVYKEIREVLSKIAEMWKFADIDSNVLMKKAGPSMDFNIRENAYTFIGE
jgi:hypothetical protein